MIGRLRGVLVEKQAPEILMDVNGVGYELQMPLTSFYELPEIDHETVVYTHFVVREDAQLLYGFITKQERALFRLLIKTNGVGPKLALTILSGMTASEFVGCVERDDIVTLVKLPGVGKKTAERVVVDLSDKVGLPTHYGRHDEPVQAELNTSDEALEALMALGYTLADATKALEGIDASLPTGKRVTEALRG